MSENTGPQLSPEHIKALGALFGKELETINKQSEDFDPRNGQGNEIDSVTDDILKGILGQQGGGKKTYDQMIAEDPHLQHIMNTLILNPQIREPVSKWLESKTKTMVSKIADIVGELFPVADSPKTPDKEAPSPNQ